jgi:hypothetical protein
LGSGIQDIFDPDAQPWYLKPGSAWSNEEFRIVSYIYFGIGGIWLLGMILFRLYDLYLISQDREESVADFCRRRMLDIKYTAILQMIAFALWFFYDFSILCARSHWLHSNDQIDYEVWGTDYEKEDEIIYWLGPAYWNASRETLASYQCPSIDELWVKDAQPVPDDACHLGPVMISAEILR